MKNFVGLKELRQNMEEYIKCVKKGEDLIVTRRYTPLFRISSIENKEEISIERRQEKTYKKSLDFVQSSEHTFIL